MDAAGFSCGADTVCDLRLGNDSVRYLCERHVCFDQHLHLYAGCSEQRCSVHLRDQPLRSCQRYRRAVRRLCADAQQAEREHHGGRHTEQYHYRLQNDRQRHNLYRDFLHDRNAVYRRKQYHFRNRYRQSWPNGNENIDLYCAGLCASVPDEVLRRAL